MRQCGGQEPSTHEGSPVDGTELKTAMLRAKVSRDELARRLGLRRPATISEWRTNGVPDEWEPLVYEALGIDMPATATPPSLARYTTVELLLELLDRERKSHGSMNNP